MREFLLFVLATLPAAAQPVLSGPAQPDPGLPRVLLVGDSISAGYESPVRELLAGKANVYRSTQAGGPTTAGLEHLDEVLRSGRWDVIHFNWGLHDIKLTSADSEHQVPLAQYESNLRTLVSKLKQSGARLIWATTTPVPRGNLRPLRKPGDEAVYNAAALRIMQSNGIAVDDLHALARPRLADWQIPENVHYTQQGYRELAAEVARHISAVLAAAGAISVGAAPFRADATPPLGAPLIWVTPAERVADPLLAKGAVIETGGRRYAICAIDWCGISGSAHKLLRDRIAAAVKTTPAEVEVHTVHQHTAPYVDGDAYRLMAALPRPLLLYPHRALEDLAARIADAAAKAVSSLRPVDRIGFGQAEVKQVGSARRLFLDGKIATRYSTSGKAPEMAAAPEGDIDRMIRTVTFESGGKPILRIHYYATHPQTFCCEGTVSADFVGEARDTVEREDGAPQIYFTGASGDVTVGKYNDGSPEKRKELAVRLAAAMRESLRSTQYEPVRAVSWRTMRLSLPARVLPAQRKALENAAKLDGQAIYRASIAVAFSERKQPIDISALFLNGGAIVHLPGEPMLEFQRYAQQLLRGRFVAVAGYGDIGPGYICTDKAYEEGGYEPSASNVGPGSEAVVRKALRELLAP